MAHVVKKPCALSHCKNWVNAGRPYGFTKVSHLLHLHFGSICRTCTPLPNRKNEIFSSSQTCTELFTLSHTALQAEKDMF